jgi:hypothetical protein
MLPSLLVLCLAFLMCALSFALNTGPHLYRSIAACSSATTFRFLQHPRHHCPHPHPHPFKARFLSVRSPAYHFHTSPFEKCLSLSSSDSFGPVHKEKNQPKDLFVKYGTAYLLTSVFLSILSYMMCYSLVSKGVNVGSLLKRLGLKVSEVSTSAGTATIAYVMHKAASPIRFPPTVALTPIVAQLLYSERRKQSQKNHF